jgi:hypothetical protein
MLISLGMAFAFVLFKSLGGPSRSSNSTADFDNVEIGQTAIRRFAKQRVWVTRLSELQARQAKLIEASLLNPQAGCKVQLTLCVLSASSTRSGIDIVYSATTPPQLAKGDQWYGGFVDPTSGEVFDFLGRAYKNVVANGQREALEVVAH